MMKGMFALLGAAALCTTVLTEASFGQCQPACNKLNVECLNPSPAYTNSRFVGQLRSSPGGAGFCTAWVIAGPDIMFTNNHCSPSVGDIVAFNYQCNNCGGAGGIAAVTEFTVTQVLACNAAEDWCLFRVSGPVAALFGQAQIDPSFTPVNTPIYEIHHAEGDVKGYDNGVVTGTNLAVGCPGSIPEHSVSVIASQGASGSPVFREDNNCVTAACNCGPPCDEGFVLPMSTIWPNLEATITAAGGAYLLCGSSEACGKGAGNCFVPNATPGCEDVDCCNLVCTADPFCCDNEWDQLCANAATLNCGNFTACGAGAGACDVANGTPGCEDEVCCAKVCNVDPFCCDTEWDLICAGQGALCTPVEACCFGDTSCDDLKPDDCVAVGGTPQGPGSDCSTSDCVNPGCGLGNCFVPNGTPGCDNPVCCTIVCSLDPFCCDNTWDALCADGAVQNCGDFTACGPGAGPCDIPNGTPGCEDAVCCAKVCNVDSFCCDTEWDQICADQAALCSSVEACCFSTGGCLELKPDDCVTAGGVPGGPGSTCATAVCTTACCFDDGTCTDLPEDSCINANGTVQGVGTLCATTACPQPTEACCFNDGACLDLLPGDCFTQGGSPQGPGTDCATTTCPVICGNPDAGNCFTPNGSPGCNNAACCQTVCAIDPFCCTTEWDQLCADEAAMLCGNFSACGKDAGCCGEPNGSPGCDIASCCAKVCLVDPFCCDNTWDQLCADAALLNCPDLPKCPPSCPQDLTGDGIVNAADLANLLGAWGPCPGCPQDLTGDGIVNAADLANMLGAWGPC